MINASARNWLESELVFLLEINWNGAIYRFSSFPVVVEDGTKSYQYIGGLEDPKIEQEMKLGFNVENNSIPLSLIFLDKDIAAEQAKDNFLDGSTGELSYVFYKSGQVLQSYSSRYKIAEGIISQPLYGYPDKPKGYVEFSLEEQARINEEIDLLEAVGSVPGLINSADFSNPDKAAGSPLPVTSNLIIDVSQFSEGKIVPFVFGITGYSYSLTSNMNKLALRNTPCYFVAFDASEYWYFIIAAHVVDATDIIIFDNKGNSHGCNVGHWVGIHNNIFAYCKSAGTGLSQWEEFRDDQSVEYWVQWRQPITNNPEGAFLSPYSNEPLENGLELILFCLSLCTDRIDWQSFFSLIPALEKYKFAGYVNEPINPVEFIDGHIIPYLPIQLVLGENGIKPVLDLSISDEYLETTQTITADSSFYCSGGIETSGDISNVTNFYEIQFAKDGLKNAYSQTIRLSPKKYDPRSTSTRGTPWFEFGTEKSLSSFLKFGLKSKTETLDYVYDYETAIQIAKDLVNKNAFPTRTVEYVANRNWGFLGLGDLIKLTDTKNGITENTAQIIKKSWDGSNWVYILELGE
jgi:hypothetical protein